MPSAKLRAGSLLTAALILSLSPSAHADTGGNIEIQAFHPALDSKGIVTLDRSQVLGNLEPSFGLVTNWTKGLVKLEGNGSTYEVQHMISPSLVGALGLRPFGLDLQLALAIPFRIVSGDRGPNSDNGTPDDPNDDRAFAFNGQGLGNVQAQVKWRVLDTSHWPIGLALITGIALPTTSQSDSWLGSSRSTPYVRLAADKELGPVGLAVNVGLRVPLGSEEFVDDSPPIIDGISAPMTGSVIHSGPSLPVGVGLSYGLVPQRFDLVAELFGQFAPEAENYQPVEALAGIKLYMAHNSYLSLGGGAGVIPDEPGSPDLRAYLGIVFEPGVGDRDQDGLMDDVDRCPDRPEDFDDFHDEDGCPEPDNDKDGILDEDDSCPLTPEDRDGVEDEDGCPEDDDFDRDGDRILDSNDSCPDDPEDYDGFEDRDGCPDLDNDKDGILDVDDLCPDDPEDVDRFDDLDGCPDPDNDGDRILDEDDQCPRIDGESAEETQETYNTVDDDDGCPDRGPVHFGDGGIVVLKKIHFRYNSDIIEEISFGILEAVAMTILTNPDLELIEVQGHTDERGSDAYNLDLSQRRANSVVRFLVEHGVEPSRLDPVGYGESKPKSFKHNEEAWAANRRVEFIIRSRTGEGH